jgi:hypothetical protein
LIPPGTLGAYDICDQTANFLSLKCLLSVNVLILLLVQIRFHIMGAHDKWDQKPTPDNFDAFNLPQNFEQTADCDDHLSKILISTDLLIRLQSTLLHRED